MTQQVGELVHETSRGGSRHVLGQEDRGPQHAVEAGAEEKRTPQDPGRGHTHLRSRGSGKARVASAGRHGPRSNPPHPALSDHQSQPPRMTEPRSHASSPIATTGGRRSSEKAAAAPGRWLRGSAARPVDPPGPFAGNGETRNRPAWGAACGGTGGLRSGNAHGDVVASVYRTGTPKHLTSRDAKHSVHPPRPWPGPPRQRDKSARQQAWSDRRPTGPRGPTASPGGRPPARGPAAPTTARSRLARNLPGSARPLQDLATRGAPLFSLGSVLASLRQSTVEVLQAPTGTACSVFSR